MPMARGFRNQILSLVCMGFYRLRNIHTVNSRYIEAGCNEVPAYIEMGLSPRVLNAFIFILYNENTVISKEYTGPLDFDITGVDCIRKLLINAYIVLPLVN